MGGSYRLFGKSHQWNTTLLGAAIGFLLLCIPMTGELLAPVLEKIKELVSGFFPGSK